MQLLKETEFILYVFDQEQSKQFYQALLARDPVLHVPGMTEFALSESCKLGLMPEAGIAKILGDHVPHVGHGRGIPRCELYLLVKDAGEAFQHAEACGAQIISPVMDRDWGHRVGYLADPDGHVIAFAQRIV